LRSLRFFELEAEPMVQGLLAGREPEEENRMLGWLVREKWQKEKEAEMLAQNPGQSVQQIVDEKFGVVAKQFTAAPSYWNQITYQWGPEAMAEFNGGMEEGMANFMDQAGRLVGETSRANIYIFLVLFWPEIKAMQESVPAKSRADFYEWIKPFAKVGVVSISNPDQLNDVCDDIGLKFKGRGAPRKAR
jgi:hypothetical protein